jgi:hypothetical protein
VNLAIQWDNRTSLVRSPTTLSLITALATSTWCRLQGVSTWVSTTNASTLLIHT